MTDSAVQLFRDEYKLPILPPEVAATMAAVQEHLFSALLIVGLASRLSALGLLIMTAVIEIFVYPDDWPEHHMIRRRLQNLAPGNAPTLDPRFASK